MKTQIRRGSLDGLAMRNSTSQSLVGGANSKALLGIGGEFGSGALTSMT
jgi:hypothetical protein